MSEHNAATCVRPCRECLRIWLDRKAYRASAGEVPLWRLRWFDESGAYLGNRGGPLPTETNGAYT